MDFAGLGYCFIFLAGGAVYAEFHGLSGTSIMESVVLKSETCYILQLTFHTMDTSAS